MCSNPSLTPSRHSSSTCLYSPVRLRIVLLFFFICFVKVCFRYNFCTQPHHDFLLHICHIISLELSVFFVAINYICLSFVQIHAHFHFYYIIYYVIHLPCIFHFPIRHCRIQFLHIPELLDGDNCTVRAIGQGNFCWVTLGQLFWFDYLFPLVNIVIKNIRENVYILYIDFRNSIYFKWYLPSVYKIVSIGFFTAFPLVLL